MAVAAVGVMGTVTVANAATNLKWNIDAITIQAAPGTGLTANSSAVTGFTGTWTLSLGSADLTSVKVGGDGSEYDGSELASLSGTITFASGTVTAGSFTWATAIGDSYAADLDAGATISHIGSFVYEVTGVTSSGTVGDGNSGFEKWAGVDSQNFIADPANGSLAGYFQSFTISDFSSSGASTLDVVAFVSSDYDPASVVPLPLAATLVIPGLGLVGIIHHRRMRQTR